jgi:hypothetical protein
VEAQRIHTLSDQETTRSAKPSTPTRLASKWETARCRVSHQPLAASALLHVGCLRIPGGRARGPGPLCLAAKPRASTPVLGQGPAE